MKSNTESAKTNKTINYNIINSIWTLDTTLQFKGKLKTSRLMVCIYFYGGFGGKIYQAQVGQFTPHMFFFPRHRKLFVCLSCGLVSELPYWTSSFNQFWDCYQALFYFFWIINCVYHHILGKKVWKVLKLPLTKCNCVKKCKYLYWSNCFLNPSVNIIF